MILPLKKLKYGMSRWTILVFSPLFLLGCSGKDVEIYKVAKESTPPAGLDQGGAAASGSSLGWNAPEDWAPQPASGMRFASFLAKGKNGGKIDISVVTLEGDAGGVLPNVNRWRGQIGLGGWEEKELAAQSARLKSPAGELLLVDMTGGQKNRLVAAILSTGGSSWFFKMTGEESDVASAKPAFQKFLRSLHHGKH